MGRKKKRKDKGALEYVSVKNRKKVKALIRELGLEFVSVEKVEEDRQSDMIESRQLFRRGSLRTFAYGEEYVLFLIVSTDR